ncbi:MAG TPA: hypothetical protein PLQ49_04210 [Methanothrix sp.]|nr:hypothetical protein [Methanothrix sp.]
MSTKSRLGILTLAIVLFAVTVTDAYTIDVLYDMDLGEYLVDEDGRTLYYYEDDTAATCNFDGDRDDWPSFYASTIDVPGELDSSDFMTIVSNDGTLQTTYKNWPLYQYVGDESSGDIEGIEQDEGMEVVSPTISPAP